MRLAATAVAVLGLWTAPAGAVVGGSAVPPGQLRAVANVQVSGVFGCSGTLIAPTWVMTAAHCGSLTGVLTSGTVPTALPFPAAAYRVYLDTVRADGEGGERHAVRRVVVAEQYTIAGGGAGDLALLELAEPSKAPPIRVAARGERRLWNPGALATIAGFGLTSQDAQQPPDGMQRARVPIQPDAACANAYGSQFDPDTMLCAGYPQGGTDTCQGDSGGPLLVRLRTGRQRLVGATSFGQGCGQAGAPGVYARVAADPLRAFVGRIAPAALAPEPRPTPKRRPAVKRKRSGQRA